MDHLRSAQQQMKELEAALDQATNSGGNAEALRAAQAAMKGLEAQLTQATAAMGLSDTTSTQGGVFTPGTSVAGDVASGGGGGGSGSGSSGPDLAVKPHANGPAKLSLSMRKNGEFALAGPSPLTQRLTVLTDACSP